MTIEIDGYLIRKRHIIYLTRIQSEGSERYGFYIILTNRNSSIHIDGIEHEVRRKRQFLLDTMGKVTVYVEHTDDKSD